MARIARLVVPGVPHHVTQRGNRRQTTFFGDDDYRLYRDLLAEAADRAGAEVWAYCLMPNHVHVILTPSDPDGLRKTLADLHRRYTAHINARNRWTGHLCKLVDTIANSGTLYLLKNLLKTSIGLYLFFLHSYVLVISKVSPNFNERQPAAAALSVISGTAPRTSPQVLKLPPADVLPSYHECCGAGDGVVIERIASASAASSDRVAFQRHDAVDTGGTHGAVSTPGADDGKIGPFLATMLVAGSMIGSGIYLLPASLGAIGSISIFGWIAASLGASVLGLVFCGLTILLPERDGLFSYIEAAFGPGPSFVAGVLYWVPTGFGPCALAVTGYLSFFLPALGAGPAATATTLAAIWLVIGANIAGPRLVARLNGVTLLFGLAPILLVAIGGWLFFQPAVFVASWNVSGQPPLTGVANATVLAFYAFLGVENAVVVAPVMRRPVRNAPIATLGGLAITTSVYLAATTVIMGMMPAAELASSNAPFADAALPLLGVSIAGPVALCAMLKAAGTLGATGLATLECIDNEAVLGQLPLAGAGLRTARMRARILIVTGLIVTLMVVGSASPTLGRSFAILADITVVLTLLVYLVACLALFKTSARARGRNRLWSRLLAVTGAVFCCGLIASSEFDLLVWSGIAVAVALAVHQVLRRFQPNPADVG